MASISMQQQTILAVSKSSGFERRRGSGQGGSPRSVANAGFENRHLENNYSKSVFATLFLFSNTLLRVFDGEKCSQSEFATVLRKLFARMLTLESQKAAPPKYTKSMGKLIKFLNITVDEETITHHEASIKRLACKNLNQASQDDFLEYQDTSLQIEPQKFELFNEAQDGKANGNRYATEPQSTANSGSARKLRKRKAQVEMSITQNRRKSSTSPPLLPKEKRVEGQKSKRQNLKREKSAKKRKSLKRHEPQALDQDLSSGSYYLPDVLQQEATQQLRDTAVAIQKGLTAQDSIHTIKEDDLTKEEDETLQDEESRELFKVESPSNRVPRSQLDVSLTKLHHQNHAHYPVGNERGIASDDSVASRHMLLKEDSAVASPQVAESLGTAESPLKGGPSLEYNPKTIKQRTTLNQILETAKKQYRDDKEMQQLSMPFKGSGSGSAAEYNADFTHPSSVAMKRKLKTCAKGKPISVENSLDFRRFPDAGQSPPSIQSKKGSLMHKNPHRITREMLKNPAILTGQRNSQRKIDQGEAKTHEQVASLRNRKFLKKITDRKKRHDSNGSSQEFDIEQLKQQILEQHLENQRRIKERNEAIEAEGVNSGSRRVLSDGRGRATLRKFADARKQKTENASLQVSMDSGLPNCTEVGDYQTISGGANMQRVTQRKRERQSNGFASLEDSFQLGRPIGAQSLNNSSHDFSMVQSHYQHSQAQNKAAKYYQNVANGRGQSNDQLDDHNTQSNVMAQSLDAKSHPRRQVIMGVAKDNKQSKNVRKSQVKEEKRGGQQERYLVQGGVMDRRNVSQGNEIVHIAKTKFIKRSRERQNSSGDRDYQGGSNPSSIYEDQEEQSQSPRLNHRRPQPVVLRQRGPRHQSNQLQQQRDEMASSGDWRRPAGGASAAVSSDGGNTFSMVAKQEAMSQMNPSKPAMMNNTLYSGKGADRPDRGAAETADGFAPSLGADYHNRINFSSVNDGGDGYQNRNGPKNMLQQQHMVRPDIDHEEPSLPQFPQSSFEARSANNSNTPLIAQSDLWQSQRKASKQQRNLASRNFEGVSHEIIIKQATASVNMNRHQTEAERQTDYNLTSQGNGNRQPLTQQETTVLKQKRMTQTSQRSKEKMHALIGGELGGINAPLIKHYQQRLHTRGPPTVVQNNEDLVLPPNPQMMRTLNDWNSAKKTFAGMVMHSQGDENGLVDEGIQSFILSQQQKRKNVQTSHIRKMVHQTNNSMQDKREIFSEEDFCNPQYHKFRLPEFSKQHHESLFESQNKRLEQQKQVFVAKAVRSSQSRVSRRQPPEEQTSVHLERPPSATFENPYLQTKSSNCATISGSLPVESQAIKVRSMPGTKGEQRRTRDQTFNYIRTKESLVNPISDPGELNSDQQHYTQQTQQPDVKQFKKPRLSYQVAAHIEADSDEESILGVGVASRRQQADDLLESQSFEGARDRNLDQHQDFPTPLTSALIERDQQEVSLHSADREFSAPDKELFEHSENMEADQDYKPQPLRQNSMNRLSPKARQESNSRFAVSPPRETSQTLQAQSSLDHVQPTQQLQQTVKNERNSSGLLLEQAARQYRTAPIQPDDEYTDREHEARADSRVKNSSKNQILSHRSHSRASDDQSSLSKRLPVGVQQKLTALNAKLKRPSGSQRFSSQPSLKDRQAGSRMQIGAQEPDDEIDYVVYAEHEESGEELTETRGANRAVGFDATKKVLRKSGLNQSNLEKRRSLLQRYSSQGQSMAQVDSRALKGPNRRHAGVRRSEVSASNRNSRQNFGQQAILPRSIHTNSNSSQPRLSRLSLEQRQKKQLP